MDNQLLLKNRVCASLLLVLIKRHQILQEECIVLENPNHEIIHELLKWCTNDVVPKITTYYTDVIALLNNTMFRQHFRMCRDTFNIILNSLGPHWQQHFAKRQQCGLEQLSLEKNLLIALWALATPDSYRSISQQFGVGKSTVYACIQRIVFLVNTVLCKHFIQWPTEGYEREMKERYFFNKCGFPQVIGAIDGCHIPIPKPEENGHDYFNRKKFYSLVLQGITDAQMRFLDVDCRWPGSVHDARVFRTSSIYDQGDILCQHHYFVVADAAYPCRSWIISPYRDNGLRTQPQRHFNQLLSKTRVVIENAFALLKGRFRRLKFLDMQKVQDQVDTIICCCVLHNICLEDSEDVQDMIREGMEPDHALHEWEDYIHAVPQVQNDFRTIITNYLWNNRR